MWRMSLSRPSTPTGLRLRLQWLLQHQHQLSITSSNNQQHLSPLLLQLHQSKSTKTITSSRPLSIHRHLKPLHLLRRQLPVQLKLPLPLRLQPHQHPMTVLPSPAANLSSSRPTISGTYKATLPSPTAQPWKATQRRQTQMMVATA